VPSGLENDSKNPQHSECVIAGGRRRRLLNEQQRSRLPAHR
jgi:hypothetical protein